MNLVLLLCGEVEEINSLGSVLLPATDRRARHIATVLKPAPEATIRVGCVGAGIGRASVQVLEDGQKGGTSGRVYIYMYMYAHVCIYTYIYIHIQSTDVYTYIYIYLYIFVDNYRQVLKGTRIWGPFKGVHPQTS